MQEIWKPIPLDYFSDYYEVSNLGGIKSITKMHRKIISHDKCEKILRPSLQSCGYCYVTLQYNKIRKNAYVHRLVAKAFIPNPLNYPVVNHLDGNKKNNNVLNLEWCTQKHNIEHSIQTGLRIVKSPVISLKSIHTPKRFPGTKGKSQKVYQFSLDGKLLHIWESGMEASKSLSIPNPGIYLCCNRKNLSYYGFIWSYIGIVPDKTIDDLKKPKQHTGKPVNQFDLSGKLINSFSSAKTAFELTGVSTTGISLCCRGKRPSASGYIWKYKGD